MKKNWKTWIAGGAALTLLVSALTLPTLAASGSRIAHLGYANMKVTLNGQTVDLRDAYGNEVEPFTINGTTYLPVASIGKALGLNVSWDNSTKTVILTTSSESQSTGTSGGAANAGSYLGEAKAREIALNHAGISASQATFVRSQFEYDDGRAVYDVDFWSGNKEYDYEIDAQSGAIVSYDFDIEGYVPGSSGGTQSSADIGAGKAKTIALNHAGVSASNAVFLHAKLDYDDGRAVYDVDFWSGNKEYDYEIDAQSGAIVSYDFDIEGYVPGSSGGTQSSADIGAGKAKTIALNHAGVSASNAVFLHAKLDYDDGRRTYEVEFYSGSKEYDYEIDAATGEILSYDFDAERYTAADSSGSYIGEARAKQIVEQRAGTTGTYREFKLERDDGRMVYEGELRSGQTEYDFTIDASTGTILEWETDR